MEASDLAHFIRDNNITARLVFLKDKTPTVEMAAEAVGVRPEQIVKSVLFVLKLGEDELQPLLVVANGSSRISYKRLANYLGLSRRQVRMAKPEQVKALTGYKVGAVPPFGHLRPLPTLIDENVLQQDEIYGGGGAINALVYLTTEELVRVVEAQVVAVVE